MHGAAFDSESKGIWGSLGPRGFGPNPLGVVSGLCIRFVLCVSTDKDSTLNLLQ